MADKAGIIESYTSQNSNQESGIPDSIKKLIDSQGVKPVQDISAFAGLIPDDEIDGFVSEIYQARKRP